MTLKKTPIGVAAVTAVLLAASVAPAASALTIDDLSDLSLPSGRYVVVLNQPAAAAEAAPDSGDIHAASTDSFSVTDPEVEQYIAQLEADQIALAESVGAQVDVSYQVALNGFVAELSGTQAAKLAVNSSVFGVYPDEILHTDAVVSSDWLGLPDSGGIWEQLGGVGNAGKGIVVGVVDTGVAPENLAFAGEPLGTTPGAEPYLDGNEIVFRKADGGEFRSERVTGEDWDESLYSTKLIGAKHFSDGAKAAGFDFGGPEFDSPRDWSGHGSHTGSTAAGNHGVEAVVNGVPTATISGVAPEAKVAHYKACFDGPDPDSRDDDICATSDLLNAIDSAVADGVDVINFSIGGGAATSVATVFDMAFYNAALAGIFVSASAGNSGPGDSTLDHASPWYTTVANTTMPDAVATATFSYERDGETEEFKASGLTIGLPTGGPLVAEAVQGVDVGLAGVDEDEAALCAPGSLDPALAAGKIIVCDRGVYTFVSKGEEIARVGGLAFMSVNTPSSAQTVFATSTAVPSIHVASQYFDGIMEALAEPGTTVSFTDGNDTGWAAPAAPIVNDSSSRGPALAGGSDIIKPDVSAPGTNVLAAIQNPVGADGAFDFLTGTSMAAPQVAGLAALYLSSKPKAGPGEVKSAIMTTAYGVKLEDGSPESNVFAQGTGNIDPARVLEPGLIYHNGPNDWAAYMKGLGYDLTATPFDRDVAPIDPSDLNLASIAIGELLGEQTVTRTVTAATPGTYTVTAPALDGLDVTVTPSTLTFDYPGEQRTFTVTFAANEDVVIDEWAMGYLTWNGAGIDVRSSVAVFPAALSAPAAVEGAGVDGSLNIEITPAFTGEVEICTTDLIIPEHLEIEGLGLIDGHTGAHDTWWDPDDGPLGGALSYPYEIFFHEVDEGVEQARFNLSATHDAGVEVDLDYELYYFGTSGLESVGMSAVEGSDEEIVVDNPRPGEYLSLITEYSSTGDYYWDARFTPLGVPGVDLVATPSSFAVEQGEPANFDISWAGLNPNETYYGLVTYCGTNARTLVVIESGEATLQPFIDVSGVVGSPTYSEFNDEITWMYTSGISTGYPVANDQLEYRPFNAVARDAMAAFLYRAAGEPEYTAPAVSPFVDVPTTHMFYTEISWLASEGISTGWDVGGGKKEFRPAASITRDAMAAFLYRYAGEPEFTAPETSPFTDVVSTQSFYKEITWLASTGVTTGWDVNGGKQFRPYNAITRDAMAAFLYRFDNL